jgi:hypothetical protein
MPTTRRTAKATSKTSATPKFRPIVADTASVPKINVVPASEANISGLYHLIS